MALSLVYLVFGLGFLAFGIALIWFRRGVTRFFADSQERTAQAIRSGLVKRVFLAGQTRQSISNTTLVGVLALVMGAMSLTFAFLLS